MAAETSGYQPLGALGLAPGVEVLQGPDAAALESEAGPASVEKLLEELTEERGGPFGELRVKGAERCEGCEEEDELVDDDLELVALEPGQMRLQGSFQGVATTHSHQLDLAVGLDVEMPSAVAAEAIRQINRRSRSSSPDKRLRLASPSPARPLELPDERRTLWNTLSDFFRRDAREGARRAAAASGQRALPDIRLKMDDYSAYKQESQRLTLDLETSQGQTAQLEAHAALLMEERDSLQSKLDLLMQEFSEQSMHMDGLRAQSEQLLSTGDTLSSELAERESEVRRLESKLAEATQTLDATTAEVTRGQLAQDRLESTLGAARRSHDLIAEENRILKGQVAELSVSLASTTANLEAKLQVTEEQLQHAEQQLVAVRCERDGLSARVVVLEADRGSLDAQLAAAEAQVLELRERCGSLEAASERDLAAKAKAEALRIEADVAGASVSTRSVQLEELPGRSEALQAQLEQLLAELAREQGAKAAAEVRAAEAKGALATAQLSLEHSQAERKSLLERVAEAPQPAEEASALHGKLDAAAAEVARLSAELSKARGEVASQERAAGSLRSQHLDALRQAADMQARVADLETQQGDHKAKAAEEAQALAQRLQTAEREAAEAAERARKATEERDQVRQELRQEKQAGLGTTARAQEEAHALRQKELRAAAQTQALEQEVRQLRERCAQLSQEVLAARSSVVVSEPIVGGPLLLQDPAVGSCLMRSVASMPTAVSPSAVPASPGGSLRTRSYRVSQPAQHSPHISVAGTVRHIGTSTRFLNAAAPPSPVVTGQAAPTSPRLSIFSQPTSPLSTGVLPGPAVSAPAVLVAATSSPVKTTAMPASAPMIRTVTVPRVAHVTLTHPMSSTKQVHGNVSIQILGVRRIQQ